MSILLHLGSLLRLGLLWMVIWGAIGAGLSIVVGIVDPPSIDPGEGPADLARILGIAGGSSGVVFGLLLLIGERGRRLADVRLLRALMWAVLAGAAQALPATREVHMGRVMNGAVFGAVAGLLTLALARATRRQLPTIP